jgi:hypothetical protein
MAFGGYSNSAKRVYSRKRERRKKGKKEEREKEIPLPSHPKVK